jgi:hypothetical protein
MTEAPDPMWDRIASDDYICALGRVVYEANRLEVVAAGRWYEWAHMAGEKPHLMFRSKAHAMTKRSPVDALIKVLNKTEPKTDRVKKHLDWAREANRLLKRRHQVTHVVYVQLDDPQVLAMYFDKDGSTGTLSTLDDPADLLKLAAEMLAHRKAGERSEIPGVEAMLAGVPDPEPGLSWIVLMPGHNPFAKGQPGT